MTTTTSDILEIIREYADPERKKKARSYYPTSMEVLGVSNPDVKKVVKEVRKHMKQLSRKEVLAFCTELVDSGILEGQMAAWFLLEREKRIIPTLTLAEMNRLMGTLDNWVSVDTFGVIIFGVLWRIGTVSDDLVIEMTGSQDIWTRRLALVGTVGLNLHSRGGEGDTERTLMICERLIDDRHDMIRKAMSWALRSLIRWDRKAVEDFLYRHDNRLPERVKREVLHKLEHGTKN